MPEQVLHDLDAFAAALRAHVRLLLFEHSPACDVSIAAHGAYRTFCATHPDVPTLFVDVLADRAVARGIAERCGVAHASPQAILFQQGRPVWHAHHDAITAGSLEAAWATTCC